jgi:hypothetical protein
MNKKRTNLLAKSKVLSLASENRTVALKALFGLRWIEILSIPRIYRSKSTIDLELQRYLPMPLWHSHHLLHHHHRLPALLVPLALARGGPHEGHSHVAVLLLIAVLFCHAPTWHEPNRPPSAVEYRHVIDCNPFFVQSVLTRQPDSTTKLCIEQMEAGK